MYSADRSFFDNGDDGLIRGLNGGLVGGVLVVVGVRGVVMLVVVVGRVIIVGDPILVGNDGRWWVVGGGLDKVGCPHRHRRH